MESLNPQLSPSSASRCASRKRCVVTSAAGCLAPGQAPRPQAQARPNRCQVSLLPVQGRLQLKKSFFFNDNHDFLPLADGASVPYTWAGPALGSVMPPHPLPSQWPTSYYPGPVN